MHNTELHVNKVLRR